MASELEIEAGALRADDCARSLIQTLLQEHTVQPLSAVECATALRLLVNAVEKVDPEISAIFWKMAPKGTKGTDDDEG